MSAFPGMNYGRLPLNPADLFIPAGILVIQQHGIALSIPGPFPEFPPTQPRQQSGESLLATSNLIGETELSKHSSQATETSCDACVYLVVLAEGLRAAELTPKITAKHSIPANSGRVIVSRQNKPSSDSTSLVSR